MIKYSAVAIGSTLLPKMSQAIAWKEDDAFINGTGAGMPLGLINAPCAITVTPEGSHDVTPPLVSEDFDNMYQRRRVERMASLVWLYNHTDLWASMAQLTRTVGTGGSAAGLVTQMPNSPEMRIYGLPLVDTEHCQAAGTPGDLILVDLSQYLVADDRTGPEISSSIHLKYDYAQTAYRVIKYCDGQPRYTSAFTRQKSTNTFSPIVLLNTRS